MLPLSFPTLSPKVYFWQVTAQAKGKFKPFNSQLHGAGWFKGLSTIHATLILLGIAAGAICILKPYPILLEQWSPSFVTQAESMVSHSGFPRTAPTKVQHRREGRKIHHSIHSDPRVLLKAPSHKETSFFLAPCHSQVNALQFASGRVTCLLKSDQLLEPQR